MTPIPTELRELLERVAEALESEIDARYGEGKTHPALARKYESDMADVNELRTLLATPPADAADMGWQAGEEVEVVAWLSEVRSGNKTVIRASMSETSLEGMRKGYRDENAVIVRDDPCMTVAQHRRILAQHRQQAGKLVEALRKIHFRADCFVEDDMDMRVPSIEAIVRIAGEALAAWEKTQ